MKLLISGAAVMLAGLALLMAMVVRLIEPGLALSLVGYASFFVGLGFGLAGAVTRLRNRL